MRERTGSLYPTSATTAKERCRFRLTGRNGIHPEGGDSLAFVRIRQCVPARRLTTGKGRGAFRKYEIPWQGKAVSGSFPHATATMGSHDGHHGHDRICCNRGAAPAGGTAQGRGAAHTGRRASGHHCGRHRRRAHLGGHAGHAGSAAMGHRRRRRTGIRRRRRAVRLGGGTAAFRPGKPSPGVS